MAGISYMVNGLVDCALFISGARRLRKSIMRGIAPGQPLGCHAPSKGARPDGWLDRETDH